VREKQQKKETTVAERNIYLRDIGWEQVLVSVEGKDQSVTWDELRAGAKESGPELQPIYQQILADAEAKARTLKMVRVEVHNRNGSDMDLGARTWSASLHRMGGELVSGKIVGAEWGQTGTRAEARRDAALARKHLTALGWVVR
jgi:hypothetical protein